MNLGTSDKPGGIQLDGQISEPESRISVVAAILGNIAVGVVKFIAAALSNSVSMFSEGIHSIVDSGNGLLILFGMHQAKKDPDFTHPFGYGKELYFWTMVVALCIFLLGGGVSIAEGVLALQDAREGTRVLGDPTMNYIVIGLAALIEGTTLFIAVKQFNQARGDVRPLAFIKDAKDPSLYTVVLEDTAAETGLLFAFLGNFLGHLLENPYLDGIASVLIGILLCSVSFVLLHETKGLLVGEGMKHSELDELRAIVEAHPKVAACGRILTMYMGPDSLLVTIDATFRDDISSHEVLDAVDEIERAVALRFPQTTRVFIEAESIRQVRMQRVEQADWDEE